MASTGTPRTAAQILVDALEIHGVDTAFCVPGESYLAVLDALYDARDSIRLVVARQDGGAAYMAEAWAKVTGRPGICFVTRGPGATNASIGVHTAQQDSTPMMLFTWRCPGGPGRWCSRFPRTCSRRRPRSPTSRLTRSCRRARRLATWTSSAACSSGRSSRS